MSEKVVDGNDVKYSLVYMNEEHIQLLKTLIKKPHEIVGYGVMKDTYMFYSIEDNYTHAILNHWTADIIKQYDNHTCWLLVKIHPCNMYRSMVAIFQPSNYVCDMHNFDIWKTEAKDCLVAVVTNISFD